MKYSDTLLGDMKDKKDYQAVDTSTMQTFSVVQGEAPPKPPSEVPAVLYFTMICLAIGVKCWQPLAIAGAKNSDGSFSFNKTTMVLLVEFVKLLFCGCVFVIQYLTSPSARRSALTDLTFRQSLHYLVPAVLYAASNTLVYYGMSYINPALFHVLGNIRIITAGVLYRFMMGKKQTDIQWAALLILTFGAAIVTPDMDEADSESSKNPLWGLFFIILMCICSTSSSIYTEKYFKKSQDVSIFYQNCILYAYGIVVNAIYLLITDSKGLMEQGFFEGYDSRALVVLAAQSTMGVTLSFVFKVTCRQYLNNIVYVISLPVSMVLTAGLSIVFYAFTISVTFVAAVGIISASIYLYYR
jgi:UDP-sugar transporter A1/2/3